ncbi:ParB family protein [Pseudomonas sp. NPDC077186]|jgi:ParB family protein of integrating conjugative element (PFGI_1 class)|uniref:ParB family protein n=1 Tax=Pseudomonas sp. NPDC077186 TaxID=3364421 RepID=UPI0025AA2816|nr:ParB family protein [Pseudomonas wenzhouensis]MDM9652649.1 ParB family protein [Pseudomonas wenzhouensis]
MATVTPEEMAGQLLAEGFSRSGPAAQVLSDPLTDTPMVVTLDDLRPYELDPRLTRNPLYDEIKTSIRERGLDAPPPITRRPGAEHFIIRNGGNTRLAILRELWSETKDERFFRIPCLFRPWPERGEIVALTGHLAENELHGGLTFIERALGVEKARELYEQESGKSLSQSELARRLSTDGYPIHQSHISRMQDTVRYLLPSIPNVLYNGLGRHQVERLAVLRKATEITWEKYASGKALVVDFETLFHDALAPFDGQPDSFSVNRVQDELIGQMSQLLDLDYNVLALDVDSTEHRQRAVNSPPQPPVETATVVNTARAGANLPDGSRSDGAAVGACGNAPNNDATPLPSPVKTPRAGASSGEDDAAVRLQGHIVSPAGNTERLQTIQHMVAEHTGDAIPTFTDTVLQAIPVQAGGLFPISDVWYIEPGLDSPDRLRIHIAQFAQEIAEQAEVPGCIEAVQTGIGFTCIAPGPGLSPSAFGQVVLALLRALSRPYAKEPDQGDVHLAASLGALLLGGCISDADALPRLSDNGLVKLFRLVRLARRLLDLEANPDEATP